MKKDSVKNMEANDYLLLLPEETLNFIRYQGNIREIAIYQEEKNEVPNEYSKMKVEGKGFYNPIVVQDFSVREKTFF